MPELTYAESVNQALRRALTEDPRVLVYGEDVAKPGGVFGVTKGLHRDFGERVFDTPISESAILGSAVGAAMVGMRPVVEIMWADFSLVALDQIVNQAANVRYISGGRVSAPMVIRTQQGNAPGACAQHSQSLEALYLHIPGIRVVLPRTPADAHDALLAAVADPDPVIVIENRTLYSAGRHPVQLGGPIRTPGWSNHLRDGDDVTVVCWGAITAAVLEAASQVADRGVAVEVVETPWLNPFPTEDVRRCVERTGRLVVVHEAVRTGGFAAEVITRMVESGVPLKAPPARVTTADTRIPAAPQLAQAVLANTGTIVSAILTCVGR